MLVPMPSDKPYSYSILPGMKVRPGSIVRVPLGPREVAGIVWDGDGGGVDLKLRPISEIFDCPPVDRDMRRFVDWIAAYTLSPPGMVARMLLRAPAAFDPEPFVDGLQLTSARPDRMTTARARVLELAVDGLAWTRSGLAHAAGVSLTVIDGLREQGVFEPVMIPPRPVVAAPDPGFAQPDLTGEQRSAADALRPTHRRRLRRDAARRCHRLSKTGSISKPRRS